MSSGVNEDETLETELRACGLTRHPCDEVGWFRPIRDERNSRRIHSELVKSQRGPLRKDDDAIGTRAKESLQLLECPIDFRRPRECPHLDKDERPDVPDLKYERAS